MTRASEVYTVSIHLRDRSRKEGVPMAVTRIDRSTMATMRIKRIFLERILSGEKTVEYRDCKPFYAFLQSPDIKYIRLHYQTNVSWVFEVKGISIIDTPERLKKSLIPFGPKVYAIRLGAYIGTL